MGDYFSKWQRKAGLLLLAMTLIFAAGWIRSYTNSDSISLLLTDWTEHELVSEESEVYWIRTRECDEKTAFEFPFILNLRFHTSPATHRVAWRRWGFRVTSTMIGLRFGNGWTCTEPNLDFAFWNVSYWAIVSPLTAASILLLFWRLGKTKSKRKFPIRCPRTDTQ